MMNVCGEIIKNNPLALFLGSGFTALTNAIVTSGVYATGAFIVSFATVAGIPVAIFVYYPYILKPILKKKNIILGLVFALVWLNTSLAQSRYIYPFFNSVTLFYWMEPIEKGTHRSGEVDAYYV